MTSADLELDCRGMLCPLPVIELGKRIGEVEVGQTVAVASTDAAAAHDIPAWCRMRGRSTSARSRPTTACRATWSGGVS